MADLLVHYALNRAVSLGARNAVLGECLILGAVLPDVLSKPFDVVLRLGWATTATHAPLIWVALAYAAASLFREPLRPPAFLGLLLGSWLHLAVDLLRDAMGGGTIALLYPFAFDQYEAVGLYCSDTSINLYPAALGLLVIAEILNARRRRRALAGAPVPAAPGCQAGPGATPST
jgi:membrane-bound metal-dependent hydrolase YbcI (DUF457 family)